MPRYRDDTPIETYQLRGRRIYVKREDLCAGPPAPPLAKLRGLRKLLEPLGSGGRTLVGCFQTRVSNIGHGLAAAAQEFPSLKCLVVYPLGKHQSIPDSVIAARNLGAKAFAIPPNRLPINYAQARRLVEQRGGVMLPFGMECPEALEAVAAEAARTPLVLLDGATVVLSCGSGITLAGLLRGFSVMPRRVIGVSSGRSLQELGKCIARHAGCVPKCVELIGAPMPYYDSPAVEAPFPCHPNYDLKAWEHLKKHLDDYSDPILFWNVGG